MEESEIATYSRAKKTTQSNVIEQVCMMIKLCQSPQKRDVAYIRHKWFVNLEQIKEKKPARYISES